MRKPTLFCGSLNFNLVVAFAQSERVEARWNELVTVRFERPLP